MAQIAALVAGATGKKKVTLGDYLMSTRLKSTQVKLSVQDLGKAFEALSKKGIVKRKGPDNGSGPRNTQSIPERRRNRVDRRAKQGAK
jgi:DNA-binding transcriptional regulator YhcF (GntR family)